jgi:hypothetical protein
MKSTTERPAKLIFANTVNALMLETPIVEHARGLFAASPRKLWLAQPGDLVVMPRRPSNAFVDYVFTLLGIDPATVTIVATAAAPTRLLAHAVLTSPALLETLQRFCHRRRDTELFCYALDAPTLELARHLGIRPAGYATDPEPEVMRTIANLNLKSGFRAVAAGAGLRIAEGSTCVGSKALRTTVLRLLARYPAVRIKLDRSSNAFGHLTVTAADGKDAAERAINHLLAECAGQQLRFVVERNLDVAESPSIELMVSMTGVATTYLCLQRYRHGQFSGMLADAGCLDPDVVAAMEDAGRGLGGHLHERGYRGVFDLDAIITRDGTLFFTEINVRRTAGTFIHELLVRLIGEEGARERVWIADSLPAPGGARFEDGLAAMQTSGLAYDIDAGRGALLTSDSVAYDGRWRYLAVAETRAQAEAIEQGLAERLPLAHARVGVRPMALSGAG